MSRSWPPYVPWVDSTSGGRERLECLTRATLWSEAEVAHDSGKRRSSKRQDVERLCHCSDGRRHRTRARCVLSRPVLGHPICGGGDESLADRTTCPDLAVFAVRRGARARNPPRDTHQVSDRDESRCRHREAGVATTRDRALPVLPSLLLVGDCRLEVCD